MVAGAVIAVLAVVLCAGGLTGLLSGEAAVGVCRPTTTASAAHPTPGAPTALPAVPGWDAEQVSNAAAIVTTGAHMMVPARGWVIAVATAIQESGLRNLAGGDRDSVGLFQQRPSQGWGTPAQLRDPVYASTKFFTKLLTVPGWETMPLTVAAQAVQVSAYPDAYAKHEAPATGLVTAVAQAAGLPVDGLAGCGATGPWTQPVLAGIVSAFHPPDRPAHNGVDLGAARGTVVRAASTGTVATVRCQAFDLATGRPWGCDRDGGPTVGGCGWYIDIAHPGGILTRYCHLGAPPPLTPGEPVAVGQPVGVVGSTGNSTGPHLHFEVHQGGDPGPGAAVDPVPFMAAHGAPLGTP